jgi:membrane protein YdbS with pleckstrin-like domain
MCAVDAVFRSKVDLWLVALVVGIPVLVLQFFFDDAGVSDRSADLIALLIVVVVLALFAWIYATTRYTITAQSLFLKSGPFSWVIPIGDITKIEPTRNPASNPSLSLERLLIHYGAGGELMISPADMERFMTLLRKRMKAQSETALR